jgi:undecaprenyl phosphate-alpha-L-ara4N flippase subunit ArnE
MGETQIGITAAIPYVAMGIVVVSNVLGNVFMKLGSSDVGPSRALLLGLFGWPTVVGIMFFAWGILFYALALKTLPLHIAQSIAALQFVGAVVAAVVVFGEVISMGKWLGIALICTGLVFVTR